MADPELSRADLLSALSALIRENHEHLVTLGVSHPSLETIRATTAAPPYGLSTKLTGAGGGGCSVTLVPDGGLFFSSVAFECLHFFSASRLCSGSARQADRGARARELRPLPHLCRRKWTWYPIPVHATQPRAAVTHRCPFRTSNTARDPRVYRCGGSPLTVGVRKAGHPGSRAVGRRSRALAVRLNSGRRPRKYVH